MIYILFFTKMILLFTIFKLSNKIFIIPSQFSHNAMEVLSLNFTVLFNVYAQINSSSKHEIQTIFFLIHDDDPR